MAADGVTGGRSLRSRSTGSKCTATSKSADTPFKQQRLFALRPILTPGCAIFLMLAMGLFFGTLGVLMIFTSEEVYEVESADYSASCCVENCSNDLWSAGGRRRDANPCAVTITVEEEMAPPVYMYYKVSNLYQNHRSYITSRDDKMLRGVEALGPEITCRSRYQCQDECSCDREGRGCNETLSVGSADHIEPCGLMAWSVFNDTFAMRSSNGTQIPLRQSGIAWESDVERRYKNADDCSTGRHFPPFRGYRKCLGARDSTTGLPLDAPAAAAAAAALGCVAADQFGADDGTACGLCTPGSGYCNEDEHFIVWMRAAGVQPFRKIWAKIEHTIPKGVYTFDVSNGFLDATNLYTDADGEAQSFLYPVRSFDGTKHIVLSTESWAGGKSTSLGVAYSVVGAVCLLVLTPLFAVREATRKDRTDARC